MLKLSTNRKYTFKETVYKRDHNGLETKEEDYTVLIKCDFKFEDEKDYSVSDLFQDKLVEEVDIKTKEQNNKVLQEASEKHRIKDMRESIIGWEGIVGEDEKPLPFNELNRKVVYEWVSSRPELITKMSQAKRGLSVKN